MASRKLKRTKLKQTLNRKSLVREKTKFLIFDRSFWSSSKIFSIVVFVLAVSGVQLLSARHLFWGWGLLLCSFFILLTVFF